MYMCMCMCVYVCVCVSCKNCTTPIGSPPALFKWNRGSLLVHPVALRNGNLILLYHLLETMSHSSVATMLLQHLGCHGGEQQSLCGPRPINPGLEKDTQHISDGKAAEQLWDVLCNLPANNFLNSV